MRATTICVAGHLTQLSCFCQQGTHYLARVPIPRLLVNSFWYWEEICLPASLPIGLALSLRATQHDCILFHTTTLHIPGNGVCVPLALLSQEEHPQLLPVSLRHHDIQTITIQAASSHLYFSLNMWYPRWKTKHFWTCPPGIPRAELTGDHMVWFCNCWEGLPFLFLSSDILPLKVYFFRSPLLKIQISPKG